MKSYFYLLCVQSGNSIFWLGDIVEGISSTQIIWSDNVFGAQELEMIGKAKRFNTVEQANEYKQSQIVIYNSLLKDFLGVIILIWIELI